MDIARALTYVFQDPGWPRKFLIALAILFVPNLLNTGSGGDLGSGLLAIVLGLLGGLFLFGYALRIARQVAAGTDLPLPEWTAWDRLATDGLKGIAVFFVWLIVPVILATVLLVVGGVSVASFGDNGGGIAGAFLLVGCLAFLVFLALFVLLPAAVVRLATTGSIAEGLNVGAVVATVRANLGDYLLILVLQIGASILLGIVSSVLAFALLGATDGPANWLAAAIVSLLTSAVSVYFSAFSYHLYGQAYYRANRGPVLPPGATYAQLD